MAGLFPYPTRKSWRVQYTLHLRDRKVRRSKYAKTQGAGRQLLRRLDELEEATRSGMAALEAIEEWIDRQWIKPDEAEIAFRGFAETRERNARHQTQGTNYDALRLAYSDYVEDRAKPTARIIRSRNLSTAMSVADRALKWLRAEFPDLRTLDVPAVEAYRRRLKNDGFAPWTIFHTLTALRILIDLGIERNMVAENPARRIRLMQPKRLKARRILTYAEIQWALTRSLEFRHVMNGGLPSAVRMGLYLGLRPIEMCWFSWDWIDWRRRLVTIGETIYKGKQGRIERWTPKDYELRVLDAKPSFFEYLRQERKRQEKAGLLNQFVLPAGNVRQPEFLGQALGQDVPQKAWKKMVQADDRDPGLTAYALRHTYCTSLLRPRAPQGTEPDPDVHGAGLDVRTVQERMGHADIRTTQEYLHGIEPERHVTDNLPY